MKTVDELKEYLGVTSDIELRKIFDASRTTILNWQKRGVPAAIVLKALEKMKDPSLRRECLSPEMQIIKEVVERWDEKRRKQLLKIVLEMHVRNNDAQRKKKGHPQVE